MLNTRDVYLMSVALPFVNYISHIVKTCISEKVKPYAIAMNEIVLT